jgi:hypothetical protein
MHALHTRPPTIEPPGRFSLRTLLLMVLALLACLQFLWRTHRTAPTRARVVPADVWLKAQEKP